MARASFLSCFFVNEVPKNATVDSKLFSQSATMLAEGHPGDGPVITPVDSVPNLALLGLCVTSVALICGFAVSWWYCRRRSEHTKLNPEKSLAFRPPRRKPTAVKSPGSTTHYLKKSPSPTGPGRSPPGSGASSGSPTDEAAPVNPGEHVTVSIENERDKAELEKSEKAEGNSRVDRGQSLAKENGACLGQLVFKLRYMLEQNALVVSVVRCKGLPARGQHNATSDPYVKLQLLPDKQHRTKTRVLRNTRDPVYDEDFTFFGISQNQLQQMSKKAPGPLHSSTHHVTPATLNIYR